MEAPQTPISLRPPKSLRPKVSRLARELGKSEGQLFNEFAEAVFRLIEEGVPRIPPLVTMVRVLRQHRATLTDEARPFPSGEYRVLRVAKEPPRRAGKGTRARSK